MTTTIANPADARAHLQDTIYVPTFLQKLAADYGIHPQSQEEAEELLGMAQNLRLARAKVASKQASHQISAIRRASNELSQALNPGFAAAGTNPTAQAVYKVAAQAALDPAIAHSALSLCILAEANNNPAG